MARDDQNYYQDTPKQIRKKIMTFKSIPEQYKAYLKEKEEGTLEVDDSWYPTLFTKKAQKQRTERNIALQEYHYLFQSRTQLLVSRRRWLW